MRIAVGIIALVLSLMVFMQSCALTGVSSIADEQAMGEAGAIGILMAFGMLLGGAFAFALPNVAKIIFAIVFLLSFAAKTDFPDAAFWGYVSLVLGVLLAFFGEKKAMTPEE